MSMSQGGQFGPGGSGQGSSMGSGQQSQYGSQPSPAANQPPSSAGSQAGPEPKGSIFDPRTMKALNTFVPFFNPASVHDIKKIENDLKQLTPEERAVFLDTMKVGCQHAMAKDEFWKKQKEFPNNDPCCQVVNACGIFNKPWFIYAAGGAAVFLAILISVAVTSVVCCMMKKKKGGYTSGGGGNTTKKSMKKSGKSKSKSKSKK